MNGGPYQSLVGQTTSTKCLVTGLTNGRTCYFAITALSGGSEGPPSEQVIATPFDTSQTVLCAGSLTEGGKWTPVIDVDSNAPAKGFPSYIGNEHLAGMLGLDDLCNYGFGNLMSENIGTKGFSLFDWGGPGSNLVQVLLPLTVTLGSGWKDLAYLNRQYRLSGVLGTNYGLLANPVGTINIGVSDTNFHRLTVISPAYSGNYMKFTLALTSTNGTSSSYVVNDANPGLTHTFQFLFKGNVALTADATSGANGIVQAVFLDDATVTAPTTNTLSPPTGFKVISSSN